MSDKQLLFIGFFIANLGFAIGFSQFRAPIFRDLVAYGFALGLIVIGEIVVGYSAKHVFGAKTKS